MIRLNDTIGLHAFRTGTAAPEHVSAGTSPRDSGTLEADFLSGVAHIRSEVEASVRGSSVSQHAANVLWHLCGDAG